MSSQGNDTPLRPCRRTGITGTTRTCRRYKVMVDSQLHPNTPRGVRKLNQTCPDKSENLLPKGCIRSLPLTSRVAELAPCVRLRDHPRVCGEQLGAGVVAVGKKGSSPRVRGAEVDLRAPRPLSGIIPACAGSSSCRRGHCGRRRDHPRMCGEQSAAPCVEAAVPGSSPRVRGAEHDGARADGDLGIIPACAGSSRTACACATCSRDHPRVCGEQLLWGDVGTGKSGSSPRVRGAAALGRRGDRQVGIIPACAGSSISAHQLRCSSRDHPRVCGEQWLRA